MNSGLMDLSKWHEINLVLKEDKVKGRCVLAGREFQAGDVVFRENPLTMVIHSNQWKHFCAGCHNSVKSGGGLKRCSKCQEFYYCSRSCQLKDWKKDHSDECATIRKLRNVLDKSNESIHSIISSILFVGRVQKRRRNGSEEEEMAVAERRWRFLPSSFANVRDLVSHHRTEEHQFTIDLMNKLSLLQAPEIKDVELMLSQFSCNNFVVTDDLLQPIASAIYPNASMVNHSCESNCVVTYDPVSRAANIRAMRAIATGDEITIQYVDTLATRETRRRKLRKTYNFDCFCSKCSFQSFPEDKDRVLDADRNGTRKADWSHNVDRDKALAHAEELMKNSTLPNLKKALIIRSQYLHPLHLDVLSCHSALLHEYCQLTDWKSAMRHCSIVVKHYEFSYPETHPMVGLNLYTLGDLQSVVQGQGLGVDQALETMNRSLEILRCTHGNESPLVVGLNEKISSQRQKQTAA